MLNLEIGTPLPSKELYQNFIEFIPKATFIAVDTESDPDFNNLFLGLSVAFPGAGMYFPVGHLEQDANIGEEFFEELIKAIKESPLRVFHNAAHDLQVFEDIGYPLDGPFADTMLMAHMVDEEVLNKGLDYLHKYYCGGEGKARHPLMQSIIDASGWRYVPTVLMNEYGTQDAVATAELFTVLRPMYEEQFGELI